MPAATRLNDNDTGHDSCSPTALATASPNVFINGRGAGRVNDPVSCGGSVAEGSGDVFIGG